MMQRGTRLVIPTQPFSVDIITMTQRVIRLVILIRLSLVDIIIMTLLEKRPVQVIRLFSEDIRITLLRAAVILQPVFMDHMIALRYGLYAASGIILWQILLQAACLLSSIMQLARLW